MKHGTDTHALLVVINRVNSAAVATATATGRIGESPPFGDMDWRTCVFLQIAFRVRAFFQKWVVFGGIKCCGKKLMEGVDFFHCEQNADSSGCIGGILHGSLMTTASD